MYGINSNVDICNVRKSVKMQLVSISYRYNLPYLFVSLRLHKPALNNFVFLYLKGLSHQFLWGLSHKIIGTGTNQDHILYSYVTVPTLTIDNVNLKGTVTPDFVGPFLACMGRSV